MKLIKTISTIALSACVFGPATPIDAGGQPPSATGLTVPGLPATGVFQRCTQLAGNCPAALGRCAGISQYLAGLIKENCGRYCAPCLSGAGGCVNEACFGALGCCWENCGPNDGENPCTACVLLPLTCWYTEPCCLFALVTGGVASVSSCMPENCSAISDSYHKFNYATTAIVECAGKPEAKIWKKVRKGLEGCAKCESLQCIIGTPDEYKALEEYLEQIPGQQEMTQGAIELTDRSNHSVSLH